MGPVVLALVAWRARAVRAALVAGPGRRLVVLGAVGLLLGLGSAWPLLGDVVPTPFDALRLLPGYGAVRAPSRFWFALVPLLAAAGAAALRVGLGRAGSRAPLVVLLVAATTLPLTWAWAARGFAGSPWLGGFGLGLGASAAARSTDVGAVAGDKARMLADLAVDRGVLRCYWPGRRHGAEFHRPGGPLALAVLGPDGAPAQGVRAQARFAGWNAIQVVVDGADGARMGPSTVVLDHEHHRHWSAAGGRVTRSPSGHLAVALPPAERPGRRAATLRFRDPWSVAGGWLSAGGWLVSAALLGACARRGRRRTAPAPIPAPAEPPA